MADEDELMAVVAHGLLQPLAAAQLAVATALDNAEVLDKEEIVRIVAMAKPHLALVVDLVKDLVRGLPAEVAQELDQLRRHT